MTIFLSPSSLYSESLSASSNIGLFSSDPSKMSDSASSPAQTYSFTTVPSQERRLFISSLTRESGYAGIPVVVSFVSFFAWFLYCLPRSHSANLLLT